MLFRSATADDSRSQDSGSEIDPQGGTDAAENVVHSATVALDGAVAEDQCSVVGKAAGRSQSPRAVGFAVCGKSAAPPHALCFRIIRRHTLPCFVRTEIPVDLCNTQKEYLICGIIPGRRIIRRIPIGDYRGIDHAVSFQIGRASCRERV